MYTGIGPGGPLFIVLFATALTVPNAIAAGSGQWRRNIEEASAEAQRSNKPLLLDFWADWCAPCKVMDAQVYTDAFLAAASQRFLPVRIDFDKQRAVARQYSVADLPTIVFTDSYGRELFRYSGFIGRKAMAELVEALPADITDFNRLDRILAADKDNFQALEGMGAKLRAAGLFRTSNVYYARALERREARSDPAIREAIFTATGLNSLALQQAAEASGVFEKCLKQFPGSERAAEWTLYLGQAYVMGERTDKARKLLEGFVQRNPEATQTRKMRELLDSLSNTAAK
jgi:thioredoxin-like negative regulator of GroEL